MLQLRIHGLQEVLTARLHCCPEQHCRLIDPLLARQYRRQIVLRAEISGFCRAPIWDEASANTKKLLEATASKLADKGAAVVDIAFAAQFNDILDDHGALSAWESTRKYADERLRHPGN